jgi:heme-degrading monooxygenase HmoA
MKGNIDVTIMLRHEREVTHFLTITHWQSEESIRAFAGDELLKAKYYPEDEHFLLEFEPTVQHFVVAALQRVNSPVVMASPLVVSFEP